MKLYLVRHGDAQPAEVDPARSLSPRGHIQIERLARWAVAAGVTVAEIRHSGKARAQETAEILATALKPARGVRAVKGLGPNDDFVRLGDDVQHETDNLMLVGHLPFMGLLAGRLLHEHPDSAVISFPAGGLMCLHREGDSWSLERALDPMSLPSTPDN